MLGCIHPMSSPMMKRMLGFCPCWAEAGMLAIVVPTHATTRAPQIVLNMLMVGFPRCWPPKQGRSLRPIHPPTVPPMRDHASGDTVGRLADRKLVEALRPRYAASADYVRGLRCRVAEGDSPKVAR